MIFRPELAEKVLAGDKTQTRRLKSDNPRSPWWRERCAYVVGREYAIQPGRGKVAIGRLLITEVREALLGDISYGDARAEGFESPSHFMRYFRELNGDLDYDAPLWALTFSLVGE